jgi:Bacterial lectin/Filamin/ABP280 repeat
VDIGSTIVGSLDAWNGISVTIDLPLQNPLAFDITLTAVELSFLYNDPDGSSVAPFGSYPPGNDLVLVDNFKQQLDPAVTIEAGQTGLIKGLQYTVESGAVEIIARIYDEVALKKRLCGSIRKGALSIAVAATNTSAAFQLEQPFEFENLSILGTAACVQNSTCTPATAPLFEYSGATQTAVTLVGDAAVARNVGQLQLTNSKTEQISAVWTVNKLQVLDDWSVTFDFKMSPGALAIGGFGDGLAFVVHSAAANAIGERCNGDAYCMGYRGIEQSLAVELKGGTAGVNPCAAAVWLNGNTTAAPPTDALAYTSNDISSGAFPRFDDDKMHTLQVQYSWLHKTITVVLDGAVQAPLLSAVVDLAAVFKASSGSAYMGFTASTGRVAYGAMLVTNWSIARPVTDYTVTALLENGLTVGQTAKQSKVTIDTRNSCGFPRYSGGDKWSVAVVNTDTSTAAAAAAVAVLDSVMDDTNGLYTVRFTVAAAGEYAVKACLQPCDVNSAASRTLGIVFVEST